jgi:hypothetical protein
MNEKQNYVGALFWLGLVVLGCFIADSVRVTRKKSWAEFAHVNNWKRRFLSKSLIPPSLRSKSSSYVYEMPIVATINQAEWTITPQRYQIEKNREGEYVTNIILSTELPKPMPYLAIDSLKNKGGLVEAPEGFDLILLEGAIQKYFAFFVQKGLYTDALSILSPDVLAVLTDYFIDFDVEIVDKMLYIISVGNERTPEKIRHLLEAGVKLRAELEHRSKSLNYESGKTFQFRGKYHQAITSTNAVYKKSLKLELMRAPFWMKLLAVVLVITLVGLITHYRIIYN